MVCDRPIATHHSVKVKSQVYRIDKGSFALLYTKDRIWVNREYHGLFEGLDLVSVCSKITADTSASSISDLGFTGELLKQGKNKRAGRTMQRDPHGRI